MNREERLRSILPDHSWKTNLADRYKRRHPHCRIGKVTPKDRLRKPYRAGMPVKHDEKLILE